MEFTEVVAARRSIRSYLNQPVEEEKLNKVLELAQLAPSWGKKQCTRYVIVKDKTKISELAKAFAGWFKQAPVIIVACADPKDSGFCNGMSYYLVDIGISVQQLVLAATDQGLGSCWIGGFDETKVKKALEIPENIKVVAMTPLGYPAADKGGWRKKLTKKPKENEKKRELSEVVHNEKW
jgi:nitroreductase